MRTTNRWSIALCSGLVIFTACDTSHAPFSAIYEDEPVAALAPAPSGLLAFYSFDQGPGNGALTGATHTAMGGYEGGAFQFDGSGDYIDLPININPSVRPQVTMGAWVRVGSLPYSGSAQVLSHDNGGYDRSIDLDQRGLDGVVPIDGKHRVSAFTGAGVLPGPVADTARWTFVAAVYDETSVTLYVDGEPYRQPTGSGEGFEFLRVGGNPGYGEAFHGTIDNVFVYDRALTAAEIATIRTGGACAIQDTCEAPRRVYFYPFDTGPGNGVRTGATHVPQGGFEGGAYYFDGVDDHIDLPIDLNTSAMPRATMGAWVRTASLPNRPSMVLSHDNAHFDRSIIVDRRGLNGSSPAFVDGQYRYSAFTGSGMLPGSVVNVGAWTFVAAVYDGATVAFYVDGQRYENPATPGPGVDFVRVGDNPMGGEAFHGWIDNVFVVNQALSDAEIAAIRNGGVGVLAATNRAPTVQAGGPYLAVEGSPVALQLSASDPDGEVLSLGWNLGDGTTGIGTPPASHTYMLSGTTELRMIAREPSGRVTTALARVDIANVRPTVLPFAGASLVQGQVYGARVSFSDPGTELWWAGSVNYSNGRGWQPLALNGKTAVVGTIYHNPGTYLVQVRVHDSDDNTPGTAFALVHVAGLAEGVTRLKTLVAQLLAADALADEQAQEVNQMLDRVAGKLADAATARTPKLEAAALQPTLAHLTQVVDLLGGANSPSAELAVVIRSEIQRRLAALGYQPRSFLSR